VFPPLMLILHPLVADAMALGSWYQVRRCSDGVMKSWHPYRDQNQAQSLRHLRYGCARNQGKGTHPSSIPEAD